MAETALKGELVALERDGWQSLCDSKGADFYGGLMTEDALMVLADGSVFDRDAVVASLAQAPGWDRYEIDDVTTIVLDDDHATLTYRGSAARGDDEFSAVMSSQYVRRDGRWRLALYQQTRLAS